MKEFMVIVNDKLQNLSIHLNVTPLWLWLNEGKWERGTEYGIFKGFGFNLTTILTRRVVVKLRALT
jgi:hypothetical protein